MDSFSAHFNYLLIILFAILAADTHDVVWYEAAPEDYFLSKTSWVKGGTVCSLLCPLLSFSLCSSSTETRERERQMCPPLTLGNVCVGGLWVSVCVTCSDRVRAPVWSRSDSFESKFFVNASWFILCPIFFFLNHVWISFIGSLCCGCSGAGFPALSFACCPLLQ